MPVTFLAINLISAFNVYLKSPITFFVSLFEKFMTLLFKKLVRAFFAHALFRELGANMSTSPRGAANSRCITDWRIERMTIFTGYS